MEQRSTKVAVDPWDVDARLGTMGLTRRHLEDAVRAGELERVSCTALDPLSYPGTAAWAVTVRNLRANLIPEGWVPKNINNLPLTVHAARRLGLLVTSGTIGTGNPDGQPTTKHAKGPMTASHVKANRQLYLFGDRPQLVPVPKKRSDLETWCLLVHATFFPKDGDTGKHVATCELSMPYAIDEDGFVDEWAERLILSPVQLDDVPTRRESLDDDDEDTGTIDVPVKRR